MATTTQLSTSDGRFGLKNCSMSRSTASTRKSRQKRCKDEKPVDIVPESTLQCSESTPKEKTHVEEKAIVRGTPEPTDADSVGEAETKPPIVPHASAVTVNTSPSSSSTSEEASSPNKHLVLPSTKSYSELPNGARTPGNPVHSPPEGGKQLAPRKKPQPGKCDSAQPSSSTTEEKSSALLGIQRRLGVSGSVKDRGRGQKAVSPESAVSAHGHRSRSPINWFLTETKSTPTSPDAALQSVAEIMGKARPAGQTPRIQESQLSQQQSKPNDEAASTEAVHAASIHDLDKSKANPTQSCSSRREQPTVLHVPITSPAGFLQPAPLSTVRATPHPPPPRLPPSNDQLMLRTTPVAATSNQHQHAQEDLGGASDADETRSEATTAYAASPKSIELYDLEAGECTASHRKSTVGQTDSHSGVVGGLLSCAGEAWKGLCRFFCGSSASSSTAAPKDQYVHMSDSVQGSSQDMTAQFATPSTADVAFAGDGSTDETLIARTYPLVQDDSSLRTCGMGQTVYVPNHPNQIYPYSGAPRFPAPELKTDALDLALTSPYTITTSQVYQRTLAQPQQHQQQYLPHSSHFSPGVPILTPFGSGLSNRTPSTGYYTMHPPNISRLVSPSLPDPYGSISVGATRHRVKTEEIPAALGDVQTARQQG